MSPHGLETLNQDLDGWELARAAFSRALSRKCHSLRVGDGGFDLGLGIFGDIHGIEVDSRHAEGELDLTGAADRVFIRHMIFTSRG